MKCHSVASLWAPSPPSHHLITAASVSISGDSLFTGAADGTILRWPLSPSPHPAALLCGHAAAIADLAAVSLVPTPAGAILVSACAAGVLCSWPTSSASSRCRCRRKLPPWAGSPRRLSPLPSSPRHVVALCATAASEGSHHHTPKWALLLVDASTLTVIRTVLHGTLAIASPKAMAVTSPTEAAAAAIDAEMKKDVIMVDANGRTQFVPVSDSTIDHDSQSESSESSIASAVAADGLEVRAEAVAIAEDGKVVALVSQSSCLLKFVSEGAMLGQISCSKNHLVGGIFLHGRAWGTRVLDDGIVVRSIVLWSSDGAAVVYKVSVSDTSFCSKPICEIPAIPSLQEGESLVQFCQFGCRLVRVESRSYKVAGSLLWKPLVSIWSLDQLESSNANSLGSPCFAKMLGEGGFVGEQFTVDNGVERSGMTVSSSMVLSEHSYAPYAVVYGFHSGEIEVIRFLNLLPEVKFGSGGIYPYISERFFLGHTGAILCLAAHHMRVRSEGQSFRRVLVSGSLDCTVRVWDLDTGILLSVLHHHVAPVRQIILPPPWTHHPWDDCFLSVGEDDLVALVSLQTMRVERMFPGHPSYPSMVAWDGMKGYIACLCRHLHSSDDAGSVLYIWDLKTGARERIIKGTASQAAFEHFCQGVRKNVVTGGILGGTTSASSLLLPIFKDTSIPQSRAKKNEEGVNMASITGNDHQAIMDATIVSTTVAQNVKGKAALRAEAHDIHDDISGYGSGKNASSQGIHRRQKLPIKCSCPYPGISSLRFDLSAIMSTQGMPNSDRQLKAHLSSHRSEEVVQHRGSDNNSEIREIDSPSRESSEGRLLRLSLCFLHLWDVDHELDRLLVDEMQVCKPEGCHIAAGVVGDRGSITLTFPSKDATLELWKNSAEFCAMRSLTIVTLSQRMIALSRSCTNASSALAAFYTRHFADKVPDIKPPLLQLLVSFWQHPSEYVRMAARTLFHCAAPRAIPHPLHVEKISIPEAPSSPSHHMEDLFSNMQSTYLSGNVESKMGTENINGDDPETSMIHSWLESFENQDWVSWIGGTSQDAMASNIIVAAALVVWYPSIVKIKLANLVVNQLIKLVMSMNDRYSSTAAELLAEGMESTWKACLGTDITHFISDVFFQIECLSGTTASNAIQNTAVAVTIREALVGTLLPSLAMADVMGFFGVVDSQIWGTASDSPVHLVSLKTLVRIVRGAPKLLAPYLDKAVNYVLHTMDPSNLVMRKACIISSMIALREIARVFPMVALNETLTRLAVGDAIGDIRDATIRVYDIESVSKIRILDASGPPGLPSLLEGASNMSTTIVITALSFSPDGEGLVAFSENGLMIRWWSLGTAWWERLTRSLAPIQCTKLIYVPPWEGFSPNSSRLSIMSSILGHDKHGNSKTTLKEFDEADNLKLLIHNFDLSYRLQWIGGRTIKLTRHGQELGTFQL